MIKSSGSLSFDERWFATALSSIGDAVIATDHRGQVLFLNPVAEALTGWPDAEAHGKELAEIFPIVNELTRTPVESPVEQVLATGQTVGLANHTVLIGRDRRECPVDDSAAPIKDEHGRVAGVILVFRDITEKRRADLLNEQLVAIVESSDDIIASKDLDGVITSWNRGAERILGYTAAEVIGKPVSMLMPPEVIEDTQRILGRIRRGETVDHYQTRRRRKDGTVIDVSLTVSPIRNAEGEIIGASKVGRDITDQRKAQELNERLAAIVESSDDIIASKDLDGVITSWNKGAERVLGYTAAEVIGRHVSMLMPPELVEDMPRILEKIRRGETVDHYQTRRRRKDGTVIDVSLTVSPIRNAEGEIIGASKIGRDITAEKRAREEREQLLGATQKAKADAEAANRLKDEFLATLSHELRTPLNAILGWSRILSSGPPDPEDLKEGLAVIDRNAKIQVQIIEDLLDISRIISGTMRLDVQRVNVAEVIEAAMTAVTPAAEGKGVRITKVLDPLAGPVSGDPARLQQIIWNLLTNAVKFTPKGGRVQVLLERVNSHVEFSVIDSGIGIRPEFLPHIFERFSQADSSTTRRHGGLGLGLAIVKQLAELHGGTVRAKSPGEGQGSTFIISLPITVVHEARPEKARPKEEQPGEYDCSERPLAGIRVLVVDDDPDARQLVRRVLTECGAEVAVAETAAEAVGLVKALRPDILVSDVGMPDQDGYDLIRQVRSRVAAKTLPAVALTAFARSEDRRRALLAGFQTHVAKPVDPAELVAVVASLVERTGGQP
ncbi:PAS domain S-box protein [Tautonia plasticadhaerens]|uniref:histidine kinase n=1 Tax=Tautonia plasticadhaerens TaxID=2527974 RepID=A0A518HDP8_9BACT|nr:PAS domain S-box protein [Tautonia plasticadhaerens]QDV38960.1 Sensor histidine kinase TodS [Tautonia plasticadhaerens]